MQKWAIKQKYKILKLYFFQEKRSWKRWDAKCWVIAAAVGPPIRRKHLLVTYLSASTNTFRKSQLYKLKKIGQNLSKFQTSVTFRNCELFFLLFFFVSNLKIKFKNGTSNPANEVDPLNQIRTRNRNYNAKVFDETKS